MYFTCKCKSVRFLDLKLIFFLYFIVKPQSNTFASTMLRKFVKLIPRILLSILNQNEQSAGMCYLSTASWPSPSRSLREPLRRVAFREASQWLLKWQTMTFRPLRHTVAIMTHWPSVQEKAGFKGKYCVTNRETRHEKISHGIVGVQEARHFHFLIQLLLHSWSLC